MAMRNHRLDPYRCRAIGTTRGLVLENGIGSGLNLPLYGPAVDRVIALDPSPELLRLASKRHASGRLTASGLDGKGTSEREDDRRPSRPASVQAREMAGPRVGLIVRPRVPWNALS